MLTFSVYWTRLGLECTSIGLHTIHLDYQFYHTIKRLQKRCEDENTVEKRNSVRFSDKKLPWAKEILNRNAYNSQYIQIRDAQLVQSVVSINKSNRFFSPEVSTR